MKTALYICFAFFCLLQANLAHSKPSRTVDTTIKLDEIKLMENDKQADIDPNLEEFHIDFTAIMYGQGCVFIVIDLPRNYEVKSDLPFKRHGIEKGLVRFKSPYLNQKKLMEKRFLISISKFYHDPRDEEKKLIVGIYPLTEGLCN